MNNVTRRVRRILTLIPYLRQRRKVSLAVASRELGCSRREILKDLDWVLMCGVPPYQPDDYIGVYVNKNEVEIAFAEGFERPVALSVSEALGVKILLETLAASGTDQLASTSRRLLEKIDSRLAGAGLVGAARRVKMRPPPAHVRKLLPQLRRGIEERTVLEIDYYSASSDTLKARAVHPYGLVHHLDGHYLIAFCEARRAVLSFRVDRVRSLRALERSFSRPDSFDLGEFKKSKHFFPSGRGIEARVHFAREVAAQALETCPATEFKKHPDGSCTARIIVEKSSWFFHWMLRFGDRARILEPPSMVAGLLAHLRSCRARLDASA